MKAKSLEISLNQIAALAHEAQTCLIVPAELSQILRSSLRPIWWNTKDAKPETPGILFLHPGRRFDPSPLIPEMLAQGHIVVTSPKSTKINHPSLLLTEDPQGLLHILAASLASRISQNFLTIGVTGTNGKTSCTFLVSQLLSRVNSEPVARLGTLGFFDGYNTFENNFPTTPDFPFFCQCLVHLHGVGTRILVMEVSSHALVEKRLGGWQFDAALLTNITPDHLDFHGTMENYIASKSLLFSEHLKQGGRALVCLEKSPWKSILQAIPENCLTSLLLSGNVPVAELEQFDTAETALLKVKSIQASGLEFDLEVRSNTKLLLIEQNQSEETLYSIQAPLTGRYQCENLALSVLTCAHFAKSPEKLAEAAQTVAAVPGRLQCVTPPERIHALPVVFVDYAHTPDGLRETLSTLREMLGAAKSKEISSVPPRLIVVFGCGGDRDKTKRPLMGQIASQWADSIVITSDNPRTEDPSAIIAEILKGIDPGQTAVTLSDRGQAIKIAIGQASAGDTVLIAGKGHEDYQIVGQISLPFSDVEFARRVLDEKYESENP